MTDNSINDMYNSLKILYKHHKHVAVKIESTWGTGQCDRLLYDFLVKNRDRQGFPEQIYKELLYLYILHRKKYGSSYEPLAQNLNLRY